MSEKIKVGIVGFGKMGKIRKSVIDNHPDLSLEGICDIVPPEQTHPVRCRFLGLCS